LRDEKRFVDMLLTARKRLGIERQTDTREGA